MKTLKKVVAMLLILAFTMAFSVSSFALTIKEPRLELDGKSAILMDANTGTVLFEKKRI